MKEKKQRPRQKPVGLLLRFFFLFVSGRFRFDRVLREESIDDKGERFTAFRKVVVDVGRRQESQRAVIFKVRFKFKNLSQMANQRLSLIPIPFIAAQPGFLSKTWLIGDRSGEFMGYYEFDTKEDAQMYWNSLPLNMMKRRAAADSLYYEIIAD